MYHHDAQRGCDVLRRHATGAFLDEPSALRVHLPGGQLHPE